MTNPYAALQDRAPENPYRELARMGQFEAFASNAADSASFGFGDEAVGGLEYARSRLGGASHEQAGGAYQRRVREARERLRQAREDRPVSSLAGSLAGSAIPGTGAARAARLALRAGVGPIGRTALALAGGTGSGALYGAGSADDQRTRLDAGLEGALWGGVTAGAFQGAGTVAGTLWRRARGTENQARNAAIDRVNNLVRESGETEEQFSQRLAAAENQPDRGQTLGEFIGQPGRDELMTAARMPGQTGQRLVDTIDNRQRGQMDRIIDDVRTAIGPRPPLAQARRELRNEYETVSRMGWRPILAQPVDEATFRTNIAPILDDEIFQRAMGRAARSARREAARETRRGAKAATIDLVKGEDGLWTFSGTPSARTLHTIKMGLDSEIVANLRRTDADALAPSEVRDLVLLKRDLLDALDEAIPGYRDVRAQYGSVAEAEEALEMGRRALAPDSRPDDLEEFVADLTPFQREYFRTGLGDAVETTLARADREGRINLANKLSSTWARRQLRAGFNDDAAFERFAGALDAEGAMHATGQRINPNIGSPTPNVLLRAEDLGGGIPSRSEIAQRLLGAGMMRVLQPKRDEIGDILLTPVRGARARMTAAERAARLRRRRELTANAFSGSVTSSVGGDTGGDVFLDDEQY